MYSRERDTGQQQKINYWSAIRKCGMIKSPHPLILKPKVICKVQQCNLVVQVCCKCVK